MKCLRINQSLPEKFDVRIFGNSVNGACRYRLDQINRADGSSIIRYKISETCKNAEIHIKYSGEHLGYSPFIIKSSIYPETCNCPQYTTNKWLLKSKCPLEEQQIKEDMIPFRVINFTNIRPKILEKYNNPGSVSLCNYVIKQNEIYRKCNGQYTGFKMFMDAILVSLVKIMRVPDMEFFINLGDFPLVKKGGQSRTTGPVPIFSWCGSDDSFDIVLPTYDITESTLENMGRVTLDMLSVQKLSRKWNEKINKGFWRGRDSRRERLDLIDLSRKFPDLLNASLTNFFFFRDEENKYGPKEAHISFFDFFDYKYQINIDGTVAAYRFPYLLAGNSVVFKQESIYYEHFYKKLIPSYHYIPLKKDLTNIVDKLVWAKLNDDKTLQIMKNANKFVNENLLPLNIYCYHALLFKVRTRMEYSE